MKQRNHLIFADTIAIKLLRIIIISADQLGKKLATTVLCISIKLGEGCCLLHPA